MSNQSIKYGILLTKEQLDFLKDDRQGFHRMTAFGTFVSMASTKPSVYLKTGFSASLSIGQFAISTVELSALWKCDRKTAARWWNCSIRWASSQPRGTTAPPYIRYYASPSGTLTASRKPSRTPSTTVNP